MRRRQTRKISLVDLHDRLTDILCQIETYFSVPVKLTLVCRTPGRPESGVLIGNDDHEQAIAEIRKLMVRAPVPGTPGSAPAAPGGGAP